MAEAQIQNVVQYLDEMRAKLEEIKYYSDKTGKWADDLFAIIRLLTDNPQYGMIEVDFGSNGEITAEKLVLKNYTISLNVPVTKLDREYIKQRILEELPKIIAKLVDDIKNLLYDYHEKLVTVYNYLTEDDDP